MDRAAGTVSVIVPSYHHADYVAETIDSTLAQDLPTDSFELIIIDDGSSDNSAEVIAAALARYPDHQTTFLQQENQGVSRTLNRALGMASGKYVLLLASDDRLLPGALRTLSDRFESLPENARYCAVYGDGLMIDARGEEMGRFSHVCPPPLLPPEKEELLVRNFIPGMGTLFRYSALEKIGFLDPAINIEDWDLLLRLAEDFDFAGVDATVFEYRLHEQNTSRDKAKMRAMFESFGGKHADWNGFYRFKRALKTADIGGVFRHGSWRNLRLLVRLGLAQVRVLYNRLRHGAPRR